MHQLLTAAPMLLFRGKDRFSAIPGRWWRAFVSLVALTQKTCNIGCRHTMHVYALTTCIVLGLCTSIAAKSESTKASFFHSELATTPAVQDNTVEALEAQAYIWMQRGRADKAAEAWRKLLLTQPQNTTALSELAIYAISVGALTEAQLRLRELQEANPQDGRLPFVRAMLREGDRVAAELREARVHSKAGRPDSALRHYWNAFGETEPTTLSGLEYYQVLATATDGWNAARTGLERLADIYPKAAHIQLALALHLTYVPSTRIRGIQLLQKLADIPAISNEMHTGWRQAVLWLSESPEALPWLRAYVNANPHDSELRHRLQELEPRLVRQEALRQAFQALEAGELDKAEEKFQSISDAECDTGALVGLASIAMARKDFDQAALLLNQARELVPQRPELWQTLLNTTELWQAIKHADTLRHAGRLGEAQALLERAATISATERYQAVLALVEVLLDRGDLPKARHNLQNLLTEPPTEAAALRRIVLLLMRANLFEEALATNKSLRAIDALAAFRPEGLRAEQLRLKAIDLHQAGDLIGAHDTLVAAARIDPRASQVCLDLANMDIELGDIDKAEHSVDALLKAEPGLPEAVLVMARLAEQRGEYERSLKLLGTIDTSTSPVEIDHLHRRLQVRLAAAKAVHTFRIGGVSAARMQLSKLERMGPNPTNLAIVAEAWANIGELDHAMLLLHSGETATADIPGVQLQLASLLLRAGRTSEASAVLKDLVAQPDLAPAELFTLRKLRVGCAVRVADSLRSLGDLDGARNELAPWTGARPAEPQITNAYGRVLQEAGDYVSAARQFSRVLKQDPGDIDALQGLTNSALNGGINLTEARRTLRQGLQVRAGDPRLHLYIARLDAKAESNTAALKELALADRLAENDKNIGARLTARDKKNRPTSEIQQSDAELERLRTEIQLETQQVRTAAGTKIKPEITMRSRLGVPGRQALFEIMAPSRLEVPNPLGTLSLQVTPITLSAGQLAIDSAGSDTMPFGTVKELIGERSIKAEGVAVGIGYGYRGLQLDIGVTPLNFKLSNIIGSLRWKGTFRDITLTLEASRRAVEESVLSFAGVSDPGTGRIWGGVVKQGGAITLRHDDRNSTSYAVLDYQYLTGTNVVSNYSLAAHLGLLWDLQQTRHTRLETGIAVSAMAFERNLSEFTFGHGGYFSPQRFLHFGLPIDWQGNYQAIAWRLTFEPGVTWFQIDKAHYYPLEKNVQQSDSIPMYPSRESLGLGIDGGMEIGYLLTPQITLGARAEMHTGDDYKELCAVAFFRFALKGGGDLRRD